MYAQAYHARHEAAMTHYFEAGIVINQAHSYYLRYREPKAMAYNIHIRVGECLQLQMGHSPDSSHQIDQMTGSTGKWKEDEDIKLKDAVQKLSSNNWVPSQTQIQCKYRWYDALNPVSTGRLEVQVPGKKRLISS
jgi:hypothetical protein